jgi:O-antigen/teichoic acid export membrane protein
MPFTIHKLGDSLYGIWILIFSLIGYGSLLDFGIRTSIVKYVAQFNSKKDQKNLNQLLNTSLFIYTIIGLASLLLTFIVSTNIIDFFRISYEDIKSAKIAVILTGITLSLRFPFGVFEGFLCGIQRYEVTNLVKIIVNLIRAIFTFIFLILGYKIVVLSIIFFISEIVGYLCMTFFCYRYLTFLKISLNCVKKDTGEIILKYSFYSFIISVSTLILYETDSIVIGLFLNTSFITVYAIANRLVKYLRLISWGFGDVFSPASSKLVAICEIDKIERLLINGTKYLLIILLPITLAYIFVGDEFIHLWVGEKYASSSGKILIILASSQVLAMAQYPAGAILYGMNKHKILALLVFLEAILNILLSIIFINNFGIIGVAWGTAIPIILVYTFILPLYVCNKVELPLIKYIKDAFWKPIKGGIFFAVCLMILNELCLESLWLIFTIKIAIASVLYAIMIYLCSLEPEEKTKLRNMFLVKKVANFASK